MKILIADDHALFRDGLRLQLEALEEDLDIHQAESFEEVVKTVSANPDMDLILLDLSMPGGSWQDSLKKLSDDFKGKIVILSASEAYDDISDALDMGVSGYIPKRSATKVLINALRLVMDGGTYLPPAMLHATSQREKNQNSSQKHVLPSGKTLTPRQLEVLQHLSKGESNKQIAYEMKVSEATVKLHINALLRNLEAHNRTQAVVVAQKLEVI